jgi:hypothetical protein
MGRFATAFRLFFKVLGDKAIAQQAQRLLEAATAPGAVEAPKAGPAAIPTPPAKPAKRQVVRNDALNLLSVLQREARLVDFLKESIGGYSDAQIGAAVRDVHRDAAGALERLFALRPVMQEAEGATVQVAAGADAARVRLVGNVTGQPPFAGTLRHAGWEATKVQLPEWTGGEAALNVVAPAEVELK